MITDFVKISDVPEEIIMEYEGTHGDGPIVFTNTGRTQKDRPRVFWQGLFRLVGAGMSGFEEANGIDPKKEITGHRDQ